MLLVEARRRICLPRRQPHAPKENIPTRRRAENSQWRVTLQRGQKALAYPQPQWPGETDPERSMPRLRRGAHSIVVEYAQPAPAFNPSPFIPNAPASKSNTAVRIPKIASSPFP